MLKLTSTATILAGLGASCVEEVVPRGSEEPATARAKHVPTVVVRDVAECRGCSLEERARALGAQPRVPMSTSEVHWAIAPEGYRDDAGRPAQYRLHVKFVDDAKVRTRNFGLRSQTRRDLSEVEALGFSYRSVFRRSEAELEALQQRAMSRSLRQQPDLAGLLAVIVPGDAPDPHDPALRIDPAPLLEAAAKLQQLDVVEFVALHWLNPPQPGDIPPETPDLTGSQGHTDPNPGVNAKEVWAMGITGENVRLTDVEYGWTEEHEEWMDLPLHPEMGHTDGQETDHGTAVLGIAMAPDNEYGITGIAPGCNDVHLYPENSKEGGRRRVEAMMNSIADSEPGDIVQLEMHVRGPGGNFAPVEVLPDVWMVTRMGTDAGVVLIGAAGNGNQDLDSDPYEEYRSWGDSGAILVGAGSPDTSHNKLGFSTFGERVTVHGWGSSVHSAGYGDWHEFDGDVRQAYTRRFSGTSSATPFVVGVSLLVQSYVKAELGRPISAVDLRQLLTDTGIAQGSGGHIGPFPDAVAAIESAIAPESNPPEVVLVDPDMDVMGDELPLKLPVLVRAMDDSGPVSEVYLELDGVPIGEADVEAPYEFELELPEAGEFELVAVGVDRWDNEGRSETVTIVLDDGDAEDESDTGSEGESAGDEAEDDEGDAGGDEEDDEEGDEGGDEADGGKGGGDGDEDGDDGDDASDEDEDAGDDAGADESEGGLEAEPGCTVASGVDGARWRRWLLTGWVARPRVDSAAR